MMAMGKRMIRRLAGWNAAVSRFFTFPLTLGQLFLLCLLLSGVGLLLFGFWLQEVESDGMGWVRVSRGRLGVNVESRLRQVEQLAGRACVSLQRGDTAGAFGLLAREDGMLLRKAQGKILVLRGDTVVLWTGNYPCNIGVRLASEEPVVLISGMWYYKRATRHGDLVSYACVGLQTEYPLENKYLKSGYVSSLSFMEGRSFSTFFQETGEARPEAASRGNAQILLGFILVLAGIFSAPLLRTRRLSIWFTLLCMGGGVVWRYLFLRADIFYGMLGQLFSPSLFALSHLMPSLGDFFFHAVVLLSVTMLGARLVRYLALSRRISQTTFLAIFGVGAILVLQLGDVLLRKIVINSTLTIPPYELSTLTFYTHVVYIGLAIWFSSGVLMAAVFCRQILRSNLQREWHLWILLLVVALLLSLYFWRQGVAPFGPSVVLCTLVFLSFYLSLRWQRGEFPFRGVELILGVVVSVYVSTCSSVESRKRDQMVREQIAERVGGDPDPLLEAMLPQLSDAVENDTILQGFVHDGYSSHARMRRYFVDRYQRDYLQGYDVRLTVCRRDELILQPERESFEDCAVYFGRVVAMEGVSVPDSRFYFRRGRSGRISYLGIFSYGEQAQARYLYVELDSKQSNAFWGYPELLVNGRTSWHKIDPRYSTALYENGVLLMQTGEYGYPHLLLATGYAAGGRKMFESGGYTHVAKLLPDDMVALVSRAKDSPFDVMGVDVYVVLLFCVLFALVLRASRALRLKPLIGRGIVGRLQLYMAGIMVLTMTFAMVIALFTMRKTLDAKNKTQMREKSQTVLTSLREINLSFTRDGDEPNWQLSRVLSELSNRLYCDINVYDSAGWLLGSSRMEIFTRSLVGERMNATAWGALHYGGGAQQITHEQIGSLSFASVYIPLRQNGELKGYVNLPHFTRPDELKKYFQSFTSLLLDFYAVLVGLMLLLSFVLANAVLSPLAQLRKSVETLSITGENKLVFYDMPDQIGELFRAYNAMLNQLANSATELAESTRQRAWQEMARQIAHDIKNPLTPIRLSLQRVMRLRSAGNPQWESRFVEFADMLENQIDVLAHTANTFSTFAKLAEGRASLVRVCESVQRCVELHSFYPGVRVISSISPVRLRVWIDENNLQRMVNNVLLNAVQAASDVENGVVEVCCYSRGDTAYIDIRDNGEGIPLDRLDDIFTVRFTTKSSGSGLGLSIAHAVAKAGGGSINFVTCPPCGTLFRISLPLARDFVAEGEK